MKEETSARKGVMRSAMAVCCAQWVPVVPPESAAKQALSAVAALASVPVGGADTAVSTAIRKKPLAS